MDLAEGMCFQCLENRIRDDFSPGEGLVFRYGISDSAFPVGSTAVVQVNLSGSNEQQSTRGDEEAQFVVLRLACQADVSTVDNVNDNTQFIMHEDINVEQTSLGNGLNQLGIDAEFHTEETKLKDCQSRSPINKNTMQRMVSITPIKKLIGSLAANIYSGSCCYSALEHLSYKYIFGDIEGLLISSLINFAEGKSGETAAADFFCVIGLGSLNETSLSHSVRHPSIVPLLAVFNSVDHVNLLYPKASYTLENILHYSPGALKSDWHITFLTYQILSALAYIHGLGFVHGNICPSNIMLTDSNWSWLNAYNAQPASPALQLDKCPAFLPRMNLCKQSCLYQSLYANLQLSTPIDWHSAFKQWWEGELSNFEYLLILNKLAGRRWGDHTFYTVMPWVIDFSASPDENSDAGWRDLQKSKWRLAKGDEQLDFTYSTSEIPHHVSDECLSELAVCSYKARRLPLNVLKSAVRSVYEPNEYPSNMLRLYQWTPDECIPEFYCDPQIFYSIHSGMSNLAVPSWAASPEQFISLHRAALESNHVSLQIHHWIDITFGYKLYGEASISAKNVMLHASDPTAAKPTGRRQLFTTPHPMRRKKVKLSNSSHVLTHDKVFSDLSNSSYQRKLLSDACNLQDLEDVTSFSEKARNLYPVYSCKHFEGLSSLEVVTEASGKGFSVTNNQGSDINMQLLMEYLEADDGASVAYQDLLHWLQRSTSSVCSRESAEDIFSLGCILAELYLKRPLFDAVSLTAYGESGVLPGVVFDLPPHVAIVVQACLQKDWRRRPSAQNLLESPYFTSTVRSAYVFLAPLQLLAKSEERLRYAATLANQGALKIMGPFVLEKCAPYCIDVIMKNLSDIEADSAICLIKELLRHLKAEAIRTLIFPTIQKILQASECSLMKVYLLQESFVREVWKRLGKQEYLEKMHPFVISCLFNSPKRNYASAASVLLIWSSEELGIPITVNQIILPLLCCFGKGLCPDGIDALVRIGGLFGQNFIVKQILPLVRNVGSSCISFLHKNRSEPLQSWNVMALIDCFTALDGLFKILPREAVPKEFIMDKLCLHIQILTQKHLDLCVIQAAATGLLALCQKVGIEATVVHVLPQLNVLFSELAFSEEAKLEAHSTNTAPKWNEQSCLRSRISLVFLLYPTLASVIGIEKLRHGCKTWLQLERYLKHVHNWEWVFGGQNSVSGSDNTSNLKSMSEKFSSSDKNPTKLLLNGVGWSIPQSQCPNDSENVTGFYKTDLQQTTSAKEGMESTLRKHEPWFWFPSVANSWEGPDFISRVGGLKDDLPWKVKASILYSARAHPGAVRALAIHPDECTVLTGGVGPGFKGIVQKWELPGMNCISGYYGHDEVVNDICILSLTGRTASCDGTIHVWNSQTGKLIAVHAEPSNNSPHHASTAIKPSKAADQSSLSASSVLSDGIMSGAFSGSLYTCMHHLESDDMLVAGTGNGSIRFIDVAQDRKLHLWKSDSAEFSFSSLISAICCCYSQKSQDGRPSGYSSLVTAGLSSGHCRLFDRRSSDIIGFWRAHDSYITKLASPEEHLLVSSSLDKTLRVWDLRRFYLFPTFYYLHIKSFFFSLKLLSCKHFYLIVSKGRFLVFHI